MDTLFTPAWAQGWGDALNASDAYRMAAARWEGAVLMDVLADPAHGLAQDTAVFLDLWHGSCRVARLAEPEDRAQARFVLRGPLAVWLQVLSGEMAPTTAILRGKIALAKGSLGGLLPHVAAANALVEVARTVTVVAPAAPAVAAPVAMAEPVADTKPAGSTGRDRAAFQSVSATGLRFGSFPMRLWDKAKRLGIWNPADIDFTQDARDWTTLAPDEQDLLRRLAALFQAGEEAVTIDILPLLDVISQEGRLEEQLYLTSFVWEEAKHVEALRRWLDAIGAAGQDLTAYQTASYRTIFVEALPQALQALRTDRSPVAQARASATYNMIVEGVLAETGYHAFHRILTERGIMPGMQQVAAYLKQDESRHLAYGVFLLSRLVIEHGDAAWNAIAERMNTLLTPAVAVIGEAFAAYPAEAMPFGLEPSVFVDYATQQFRRRMDRVERARSQTMAELQAGDETM